MSFSQSLSIGLHPFLSCSPSSDKKQKPHAQKTLELLLQHVHPSWLAAPNPKVRSLDPLGETPDVPVQVVLVVVADVSDKGHGAGDVEAPHLHPRPPLQTRSTHQVQKILGPEFRRTLCRALTLQKGYSSPTVQFLH